MSAAGYLLDTEPIRKAREVTLIFPTRVSVVVNDEDLVPFSFLEAGQVLAILPERERNQIATETRLKSAILACDGIRPFEMPRH